MRVLIVEDSEQVSNMLSEYFAKIADEVIVAYSMSEALVEIGKVEPFDIVTLDLGLPDSSVHNTISRVGEIKALNPECLLVVISGMVLSNRDMEALEGADGFIEKMQSITAPNSFFVNLWDVFRSCVRTPVRYQKNLALLEELAKNVSMQTPVA